MGLFGRGGRTAMNDFSSNESEPASLDLTGDKARIKEEGIVPIAEEDSSSTFSNRGGMPETYQSSGPSSRPRIDTVHDFSDMQSADGVQDKDISTLRKKGYRLSNLEKEFDIRHKNDFNNIAKVILICFSIFVGFAFLVIIAVITWTSWKAGAMTETGIIGTILQFIAEMVKISLG